ncbi:MAG: hypothetical protein HYU36_08290 [Planctomycetes bacterium]|nr:hypothetical protein [Planctomycetota bacterium]
MQTTLSIKVGARFAKEFETFCEAHGLQVGRFTEKALREIMEDYHLGQKAQAILSRSEGKTISHGAFLRR